MDGELESIFGAAMEAQSAVADEAVKPSSSDEAKAGVNDTSEVPTTEPLTRLASFVLESFRVNADHRRNSGVEQRLKDAIAAQTCRYNAEQIEKMRKAGIDPKVYAPITATKVRAAKAMLVDIFSSSGEWPFTVTPTPDPEMPKTVTEMVVSEGEERIAALIADVQSAGMESIPPQMMMKIKGLITSFVEGRYDEISNRIGHIASVRASRMERKVQDMMTEGGWFDAFHEYVDYICTYGTGLIVGPVPRVMPVNRCKEGKSGVPKYTREYRSIPTYEAVSPVDCYPAPDAKSVDDGPLCIRVKYMPNELRQYVNSSEESYNSSYGRGWMVGTMKSLLRRWPHGGCKVREEWRDLEIREAEKNGSDDSRDCTMEGIRCFASVMGSDLIQFGITKSADGMKIVSDRFYSTETIVIDNYVVYCRIIDDRLGRPVSKGVFYELPGSWWGESIADKLSLVQSVMNNAIKALMQNMAVASGPMYWINDISRLHDKSPTGTQPRPHKIFSFNASYGQNSGAPMGVIQVPSNASELIAVWDKMRIQADDDSGIPAYTYGQTSGQGALRTASGLAIFTEAASRGMKMVVGTTDRLVTRDQVRKTCNWILLYDDDVDLKGDCEINPAGVMGKILKAQQDQQRLQFLNMAISNPMLQQIFGPKGIVSLLRPSIQDLAINPDDVLPSEERLMEIELMQDIQALQQAVQAKAAQDEQQGAVAGVEQPPKIQGGVAERQGAA